MLDLTAELAILQLIPLQAGTGTITGPAVAVNTLNTGDLDLASLNVIGGSSYGTITVQLQQSANGTSGWANIPTTAQMPNTAFPVVSAALTSPSVIPIDPRAIGPYIRAVATVAGGVTGFQIEVQLFARNLQIGFPSTSG
jgi:hypothetical protein